MRSMWNGAISFGLVHIPVSLYSAVEKSDIKFNYLHKECKTPINYQKHCATCNRAISHEEIVRGYQYEPGHYVIIAEEDIEALPSATSKTINIIDFVDLQEIDPIYFEKSYYLGPNQGGHKAFNLLHDSLSDTNKIAVAKVTIRSRESLAVIRVYQNALLLETMIFPEEIRSVDNIPHLGQEVEIHSNELKMAKNLIKSLSSPFEPTKYTNDYRKQLSKLIEEKITGKEVVAAVRPDQPDKVVDLMEALKASIELAKETKPKKKESKQKKKAVGENE